MCHWHKDDTPARNPNKTRLTPKGPALRDLSHALEWTRTTTGRKAHKALNLARLPIPPRARSARGWPRDCREERTLLAELVRRSAAQHATALAARKSATCVRPRPALQCEHVFVS